MAPHDSVRNPGMIGWIPAFCSNSPAENLDQVYDRSFRFGLLNHSSRISQLFYESFYHDCIFLACTKYKPVVGDRCMYMLCSFVLHFLTLRDVLHGRFPMCCWSSVPRVNKTTKVHIYIYKLFSEEILLPFKFLLPVDPQFNTVNLG